MAQYTERNALLRELCVTEGELTQLRQLDLDEALWRINHEEKMHIRWAKDRAEFIRDEIRRALKKKPVVATRRITGEPGIVSHATGRPGTSNQHFGEKFG